MDSQWSDNNIWYEKYRPTKLDQMVLSNDSRQAFKDYIKKKTLPHLIFYGPPGSGKTTMSRILINTCGGAKLILNASSKDRGISTIRQTVTQFAASQVKTKGRLNIVFFDEADGLTPDAQEALKNTIETYNKNCRFIFTANEISKITDAIYSRCLAFHFETVPIPNLKMHLQRILDSEKINYKKKDLRTLINKFYPDIRSIINNLQACSISGVLDPMSTLPIIDTRDIKTYLNEGMILAVRSKWSGMTSFTWLYKWLFDEYVPKLAKDIRAEAALAVAEYLNRDSTVLDKEINATACCLEIMSIMEIDVDFETPF